MADAAARPVDDSGWVDVPAPAAPSPSGDSGWVDVPAPAATPAPEVKMPYPEPGGGSKEAPSGSPLASTVSAAKEFGKGVWDVMNPVTAAQGVTQAVEHPINTLQNLAAQQNAALGRAVQSYHQGNYMDAARHFVGYLLPIVGPQIDMMGDLAQRGHLARAAGEAIGFGATSAVGARSALVPEATAAPRVAVTGEAIPTAAETAAQVAERASPETALADYMKARDIAAAKAAYQSASPSMRQTMQQHQLFQVMKQSGGDPAAFGRLMDEWKDAIPLEDHPIWEGAKKAAQFEQNAQAVTKTPWRSAVDAVSLPVDVAAMLHVPGAAAARHVLAGAETLNWLMARPGGRNILSQLGKLSPASPKFAGLWSTAKAAAAATPAAQALKPSQPAPYAGGGPVMERLRRDTLRQLRGS